VRVLSKSQDAEMLALLDELSAAVERLSGDLREARVERDLWMGRCAKLVDQFNFVIDNEGLR
jgi:hypothetical protein